MAHVTNLNLDIEPPQQGVWRRRSFVRGEIFVVAGGGGFYGEFSEGGETENRLSDSN